MLRETHGSWEILVGEKKHERRAAKRGRSGRMSKGTNLTGTPDGATGPEAELEPTALATMRAMLTALDALVRSVPADLLERRPAPDEWSPREVLGHLLYVERLLRDRVAAMVADDQDTPMPKGAPAPSAAAPSASLAEWRRERGQTLAWLPTLGPAELERASVSPRFGRITAREQIDEWAYHDLDHLRQVLASIETDLYPRIGGYRRLYPPPFPAASSADDGQLPPAAAPVGSD
jgi:DinB superfamily